MLLQSERNTSSVEFTATPQLDAALAIVWHRERNTSSVELTATVSRDAHNGKTFA